MSVPKRRGKGVRKLRRFTPFEDQFIQENYIKLTCSEIGRALDRATNSVYGRIKRLGLSIPAEEVKRRRNLGTEAQRNNAGTFKKGSVPHNKGIKGWVVYNERTRFKNGSKGT